MVKKVTGFRFTLHFKKKYQSLPKNIQNRFDETLSLLLRDVCHPSLRIKRIQGTKALWEGAVTMKYRFTFQFENGEVIFRTIGTHEILIQEAKSE